MYMDLIMGTIHYTVIRMTPGHGGACMYIRPQKGSVQSMEYLDKLQAQLFSTLKQIILKIMSVITDLHLRRLQCITC
jgi:hypothetical protein